MTNERTRKKKQIYEIFISCKAKKMKEIIARKINDDNTDEIHCCCFFMNQEGKI